VWTEFGHIPLDGSAHKFCEVNNNCTQFVLGLTSSIFTMLRYIIAATFLIFTVPGALSDNLVRNLNSCSVVKPTRLSRSKSLLSSQTPLVSLPPSLSPSIAAVLATAVPTVKLSKFDWDMERVGDAIVVFSDSTASREITLSYIISNREFKVSVFEQNCVTPVPDTVIGIWSESIIATSTHSNLAVYLDVKLDAIARSSPIWMDLGGAQVILLLCVRVDLVLPDDGIHHETSINFHEQKLHLTVDLRQGFSLVKVVALKQNLNNATEISATFGCSNNNSDEFVCLNFNVTGIEICAVSSLSFIQGNMTISPTEVAVTITSNGVVIHALLPSIFFDGDQSKDISVQGVVSLCFDSTIATDPGNDREHQQNALKPGQAFTVSMIIDRAPPTAPHSDEPTDTPTRSPARLPTYVRTSNHTSGSGTAKVSGGAEFFASGGAASIVVILMIAVATVSICCLACFLTRRRLAHSVDIDCESDSHSETC
jgi:hypothetical protein